MGGGKGVEELEAVLLKAEDVYLLVVEVGIQLAIHPRETALVEIVPNWLQEWGEAHILEVVFYDELEVFVDREDGNHVEGRLHSVEDGIGIMSREGMRIESLRILLMKRLYGNHKDWGIEKDTHLVVTPHQEVALLERLAQVGCERHATLHGV